MDLELLFALIGVAFAATLLGTVILAVILVWLFGGDDGPRS